MKYEITLWFDFEGTRAEAREMADRAAVALIPLDIQISGRVVLQEEPRVLSGSNV